ncbi:MAG: hypothetical protein KJP01_02300, partial [Gramella sp.]|nr:hypothetical protein [Christiangramia sp.]
AYAAYMGSLPSKLTEGIKGRNYSLWYSNSSKFSNENKNLINASLDEPVQKIEGVFRRIFGKKRA